MTHAAIAQEPATLVPEARRMAFLPALFSPALSHSSFRHEADQLSEAYMRLYEFAGEHPEAGEIFKAID